VGRGVLADVGGEGVEGDVVEGRELVAALEEFDGAFVEHLVQRVELFDELHLLVFAELLYFRAL
jgi:hypothetical protein